ncbi:NADAR family protein [uncultured Tenacibaculum sp.]|uniref:NADAR family protein n=1 Tax=uncultured Tenacibaculum sp. TaxID=174713 RepID=UPI002604B1BB|nr:NADAR family protein [uncultured Tenacibaculum sp.]
MKYSNTTIQERYNTGEHLKYIFFWGHQPNKDGSISKSCFSQWWESDFVINGITYKTAEHYMMAEKARLFNDEEVLEEILSSNHPHDVKQLGRKVKGFNSSVWDNQKYLIVYKGNLGKFSQNDALKEFLMNTKDRILVEASPYDKVWGVGLASDYKNIENPNRWKGLNLLGFVLMEVRDHLRKN